MTASNWSAAVPGHPYHVFGSPLYKTNVSVTKNRSNWCNAHKTKFEEQVSVNVLETYAVSAISQNPAQQTGAIS